MVGQWFSPCTPVFSNIKTDRYDITEILLKVPLNTINQNNLYCIFCTLYIKLFNKYFYKPSDDVGSKVCIICDWPTSFLYKNDWKQYNTAHLSVNGCFSFTIDISNTTIAGLKCQTIAVKQQLTSMWLVVMELNNSIHLVWWKYKVSFNYWYAILTNKLILESHVILYVFWLV